MSKKNYEKFFIENLPFNKSYLKPQNEPVVLKIDRCTHELIPQLELSAAFLTCNTQMTTIASIRPSQFLEMEDITLNYDVYDLEQML